MSKHESVTFGKEVANALLQTGVSVQNQLGFPLIPDMSVAEDLVYRPDLEYAPDPCEAVATPDPLADD